MEEKKAKRFIWWISAAIAVILCTVTVLLLIPSEGQDAADKPTEPTIPSVLQTPAPTVLSPEPTVEPTAYLLPLVPLWETPAASPSASASGAAQPEPTISPTEGRYDTTCKDLLAVGIRNGVATAILLVRIQDGVMTVLAVPCELNGPVYTLDRECTVLSVDDAPLSSALRRGGTRKKQQLWNLVWAVKNTVGVSAAHYVAIDLDCLAAVVEELGCLEGQSVRILPDAVPSLLLLTGEARAVAMSEVGVGFVRAMQHATIWELPALQKLTKNKLFSSLSVRQMISLAGEFGRIQTISTYVLPLSYQNAGASLLMPDAQKMLEKLYQ